MFADLGRFPMINDDGVVAFCAAPRSGPLGVFLASGGTIQSLIDARAGFESFRGALLNNRGRIVIIATPGGGTLAVFTGPDPGADEVLRLGAPLLDSTVVDFAFNPVSYNDAGQIAIRVRLADQRPLVLRADPCGPTFA